MERSPCRDRGPGLAPRPKYRKRACVASGAGVLNFRRPEYMVGMGESVTTSRGQVLHQASRPPNLPWAQPLG